MNKKCAIALLLMTMIIPSHAQKAAWQPNPEHPSVRLWPHGVPGAPRTTQPEVDTTTAKDALIAGKPVVRLGNVSEPTLTFYAAKRDNTGATVVVFPGGAYRILALDLEGTEVCDWLTSIGLNCALLKYRVPESGPYPEHAAALQDAQRALRVVRARAAQWHIDVHRVGVLGFSAGGHLAAALGAHFDTPTYEKMDDAEHLSCRPDFTVLVYPAYLADEHKGFALNPNVRPIAQTPPTFIVQTEDDPIHVENATVYYRALKDARVPAEVHLYAEGGHGYGLRGTELPVTGWPTLVECWLHTTKILRDNAK
jgi:acetyl esterase/lipase